MLCHLSLFDLKKNCKGVAVLLPSHPLLLSLCQCWASSRKRKITGGNQEETKESKEKIHKKLQEIKAEEEE